MNRLLISVAAMVALAGCAPVQMYNQSQDELRASTEKFGGKQTVAMPMDKFLNNVFLTTRHCVDHPEYTIAPDLRSMTATLMFIGWTQPAYQVVIDADTAENGVEISYWANDLWRNRAQTWIEQMKNPEICKAKKG